MQKILLSLLMLTAMPAMAQQQAKKVYISPIGYESELMCEAMSPNMTYQAGVNFATFNPVVWNIFTDEVKDYQGYEEGAYHAVNNSGTAVGDDGLALDGVTPGDGFAIISRPDGTAERLYYNPNGTWERILDPVSGQDSIDIYRGELGSAAWDISDDGRTIVGYYYDEGYKTTPCIWRDGVRIDLPLPAASAVSFEFDGAEARWITPDASVIGGFLFDALSLWPACIWRLQADGTYECDPVCSRFFELNPGEGKPYMMFTPSSLSQNGEWMGITVQPEYEGWNAPQQQAARLNLRTMEVELCAPIEGLDQSACGIANNGTLSLYTTPYGSEPSIMGRRGFIWMAGEKEAKEITLFVEDESVEGSTEIQNIGGYSISMSAVSADGRCFQGFGFDASATICSFLIDLDYETEGVRRPHLSTLSMKQAPAYNLLGTRAKQADKGVLIQQGKKVVR